jgi:hypothetical protein
VSTFTQTVIDRGFLIGTLFLLDYFLQLYLGFAIRFSSYWPTQRGEGQYPYENFDLVREST